MGSNLEDYALIGDCQAAALVSREGSIDWLCWPRFDSGACFAALLGTRENGRWLIGAVDPKARLSRRYRDSTLILETEIETADGAATVIDFMPPRGKNSDVVRLVRGKRGRVVMRTELIVRFDYGSLVPWVTNSLINPGGGAWRAVCGPDMVVLRTPVELRGKDLTTIGEFTVAAGETVPFALTYGPSYLARPGVIDAAEALRETETFWRGWASRAQPAGEWSDATQRSLITLKALTHFPTGGMVAAPTTSLPECLGGKRNWDYRFCWLRDATFTLIALMNAGYYEDARAWREWLLRAVAGAPDRVQIMYAVTGERRLPEWQVPWLSGYQGAKPVRVGNAAAEQVQIDVYGEVMDALHHGRHGNLGPSAEGWQLQCALLDHLENIWQEADHGIWEVRGDRQLFTNSKVMAWVAFDRAVKTVEHFKVEGPVERWRKLRRAIHDDVCRFGFDPSLGAFVQSYGSKHLDASALLIPLVGFLPPEDPRARSTVEAIQRHLGVEGLLRRYDSEAGLDGLPSGEGVFLPCSFWLADNLILLGRRDEARRLFERLLSLRNDVGLLSEEYDVKAKRLIGNFPQALSHVALINTAHHLTEQSRHKRHEPGEPAAQDVAAE
jgi:GH15 family glucan-1,4-alpha-glucosidase